MAALDHAIEPRLGDVEHAAQVVDVDEAHAALSFAAASYRGQATACAPGGSGSGRSMRQRSNANAQRGLNEQPLGIADSRGIEPGICTRRAASPASVGIAPIRPLA